MICYKHSRQCDTDGFCLECGEISRFTKNPRLNKRLIGLWLTSQEEYEIKEAIEILNGRATSRENGYAISKISEIIQEAKNRGDLQ